MKKITIIALMCIAFPAVANGPGIQVNSQSLSASQGGNATSGATTSGNAQNIVIEAPEIPSETVSRIKHNGSQTIRNVPSMGVAPLTSSYDTCMGSVAVSGAGVGFGIGIGTTYTDDNCIMLKNSRELWNMGMKGAAIARMCMDEKNLEALELSGFTCPQTERAEKAAKLKMATSLDKVPDQKEYQSPTWDDMYRP